MVRKSSGKKAQCSRGFATKRGEKNEVQLSSEMQRLASCCFYTEALKGTGINWEIMNKLSKTTRVIRVVCYQARFVDVVQYNTPCFENDPICHFSSYDFAWKTVSTSCLVCLNVMIFSVCVCWWKDRDGQGDEATPLVGTGAQPPGEPRTDGYGTLH